VSEWTVAPHAAVVNGNAGPERGTPASARTATRRRTNMKRNTKGFTLMELMVVIVIVAILAAVAVPLYVNYVKDAQRTEAKGAIGAVITAQQTHYQLKGTYVGSETFQPNALGQTLNCDLTDALVNWDIAVTEGDAEKFTVVATGKGNSAGRRVELQYSRTTGPKWIED
jgi:type IV pilus assembly protein PilE